MFLRAEVDRVHEILDERPSASSSVKECLTCAKMQESQKKLEKLIDSQKVCKGKACIGYSPSTEKVKGKAIVKEMNGTERKKLNGSEKKKLNGTEKKKNFAKKFYGNCLKCNTYGHKASDCKVVKKIEKVPTRNKSAMLEIKCFKCGMIGHMAKQCMKKVNMKCFKCGKVGHYAWSCMQNNLIQCYRCHTFGHIARNCMNVLPSHKNLIVDRLNLLKPITIDEKAVWRDKRKSVIQSDEAEKQNGKKKKKFQQCVCTR